MHQYLFQRIYAVCVSVPGLVDFAKRSLAEFLKHLIIVDLGAAVEAARDALWGFMGRSGHCCEARIRSIWGRALGRCSGLAVRGGGSRAVARRRAQRRALPLVIDESRREFLLLAIRPIVRASRGFTDN